MSETITETLERLQIQPAVLVELLGASGQIDAHLHRLLALTLDKQVNSKGWNYQLTSAILLSLIENEITKEHGFILTTNPSHETKILKKMQSYYNNIQRNKLLYAWLERKSLDKKELKQLSRTLLQEAYRYEVMLAKLLAIIPSHLRLREIKRASYYNCFYQDKQNQHHSTNDSENEDLSDDEEQPTPVSYYYDSAAEANPSDIPEDDSLLRQTLPYVNSAKLILSFYPEAERISVMESLADHWNNSLLNEKSQHASLFELIVNLYPSHQRLDVITRKDKYNGSLMLKAAANPNNLRLILSILPEQDKVAAIENKELLSLFSMAAKNHLAFNMLLEHCSIEIRHLVIKDIQIFFSAAENNVAVLKQMFAAFSIKEQLDLLEKTNAYNYNVLYYAACNKDIEATKYLLAHYPEHKRLAAILKTNSRKDTVLHYAARSGSCAVIKLLLSLFPAVERLTIINFKNEQSDSIIYSKYYRSKIALSILKMLPETDRYSALLNTTVEGKYGYKHSLLEDLAFKHVDVLPKLIKLLPEDYQLDFFTFQKGALLRAVFEKPMLLRDLLANLAEPIRWKLLQLDHSQFLFDIVENKDSLKFYRLIEALSNEQKQALFELSNHKGSTVLHRATQNNLRKLLQVMPENTRLKNLLTIPNAAEKSFIQYLADEHKLPNLIDLFSTDELLTLLDFPFADSSTLLHIIAGDKPALIRPLLELLPTQQWYTMLAKMDVDDCNVLHALDRTCKPSDLAPVLAALSMENRIALISQKEYNDITVLKNLCQTDEVNGSLITLILSYLPADMRLELLTDDDLPIHSLIQDCDNLDLADILGLLTPEQCLQGFQTIHDSGQSIFKRIKDSEKALTILRAIPAEARLSLLTDASLQNFKGNTLFHKHIENLAFLTAVIELLPEKDRLAALELKNFNQDSVLHAAFNYDAVCLWLLSFYPRQARCNVLNQPNKQGLTLWQMASHAPDKLQLLMDAIDKQHWLDLLVILSPFHQTYLTTLIQNTVFAQLADIAGGKLLRAMLESLAPVAQIEALLSWLNNPRLLLMNTVNFFKWADSGADLVPLYQDFCCAPNVFSAEPDAYQSCQEKLDKIMYKKQHPIKAITSHGLFGTGLKRERDQLSYLELEHERLQDKLLVLHMSQQTAKAEQLGTQLHVIANQIESSKQTQTELPRTELQSPSKSPF